MAYAAAVSLLQVLKQLQESDQFSIAQYPKSQIHHLKGKVRSLKDFLEKNSSLEDNSGSTTHLETEIRKVIYEADNIIESHMFDHFIASRSTGSGEETRMSTFCEDLQRVIQRIDSIAEETVQFTVSQNSHVVGRYEDIVQLMDRLRGSTSELEVVPIFGIRGIGKTTLATAVYNEPLIKSEFEVRAWIKVSREYLKRDVLMGLLRSMNALGGGQRQETDDQLIRNLRKSLKSKKYLVVLDDVCDVEVWSDLREILPDDGNGSRVIQTTRTMNVARFADENGPPHEVRELAEDDSWTLFCIMLFPCRLFPELEQVAKNIAAQCRGLPLAIVVIGRVLAKAGIRGWQTASSSISETTENHDEFVEVVLSLNYRSLPQYLKACLLYMGMFPRNYGIPLSKLIKLWIAEGFLELNSFQTLKEMAEDIILQLVSRSLVSVCEQSSSSRIKTCMIDDVYRDFVRTKAEEDNFFHVIHKHERYLLEDTCAVRRLCIFENICLGTKELDNYNSKEWVSTARSLLYCGPVHQHPLPCWLGFKLLRVLDALDIHFYSFPLEILNLVQLRYLAFTCNRELPEYICKLRNLQVLIVLRNLSSKYSGHRFHLPVEIWNMKELRHLQVMGRDLLDTSNFAGGSRILGSLLVLLDVSSHSCTPGVLHRITNLKKLGIRIESPALDASENFSFLSHLHILHQLESLKCVVMHPDFSSQVMTSVLAPLPLTLCKLSLSGCGFSWKSMKLIAALPNLEVLKLQNYSFRGFKWKLTKVEFIRLKFLQLEDMDVVKWIASRANFPSLVSLIVRHCYRLRKIPKGFGEIETLEMIEVDGCNQSVVDSVQPILDKQREIGNDDLQVRVFME